MANSYFQFKQFTVYQDKTAMKVGTDGVLLGALAGNELKSDDELKMLDIGTGTGLVSLMLAQRFSKAQITAVEIDNQASEQATENFEKSPFVSRLRVVNKDIREAKFDSLFDVIVSNPPYFVDSLKAPDQKRSMARHTDTLSFEELAISVSRLLSPEGKAVIIIPYDASQTLIEEFGKHGLKNKSLVKVKPNEVKTPKRSIITFGRNDENEVSESEIIIEKSPRVYTDEFCELVSPFYLKL